MGKEELMFHIDVLLILFLHLSFNTFLSEGSSLKCLDQSYIYMFHRIFETVCSLGPDIHFSSIIFKDALIGIPLQNGHA